jgi:hypothetical protein
MDAMPRCCVGPLSISSHLRFCFAKDRQWCYVYFRVRVDFVTFHARDTKQKALAFISIER